MSYQKGNLILFDHETYAERPNPILKGMVDYVTATKVVLTGGYTIPIKNCAGIPLNQEWNQKFEHWPAEKFFYVHEMQNAYFEKYGKLLEIKIKRPLF